MERFVRIYRVDSISDHVMLTEMDKLVSIERATLVDCTADNVEKTEEMVACLVEVAQALYKMEDSHNLNCPLKALRETIEMQLGRDVTRNTHR